MPNDRRRVAIVAITFTEVPTSGYGLALSPTERETLSEDGFWNENGIRQLLLERLKSGSYMKDLEVVLLQDQGEV